MALRNIVTTGDEVLEKKGRPVENFDKRLLILLEDMAETLQKANGIGLAAPQVGVRRRVAIVDAGDGILELVNPAIIEMSEEETEAMEGCLSFPGQYGVVKRPAKVKVKAQNRNGKWFETEGEGLLARAFCHEIDHLDGVLFVTKAGRMLTPEEIAALQQEEEEEMDEEKA